MMITGKISRAIAGETERHGVSGHGFTCSGHPVAGALDEIWARVQDDDRGG